jgi:Tol biopolymer transport system component
MGIPIIARSSRCNLSTAFAIMALALLLASLFSFPVHAEQWSPPIQVTFDMNIAYDWGGPSISDDGSRIVFQYYVDGYYQAFVVNTDGSGLTQVTHDQRNYVHLSISGDGSKIAVSSYVPSTPGSFSDSEAFVINTDGSGVIPLLARQSLGEAPQISDDGSKVALTAFKEGGYGGYALFVVNSDGTGLKQLTNDTMHASHPSISSDGSKIAFFSNTGIFVINADGTGLTQLFNTTSSVSSPSISGDGSKVAFVSYIGTFNFDGEDVYIPTSEIFVVNTDGTGLTQVTNNTMSEVTPSINYDGSKIAFSSYMGGSNSEVFVINSDGTGLHQITQSEKNDNFPSISGDGSKIAFISFEGNVNGEIFVSVDIDQDSTAPVTVDNYDNSWHVVDYKINLAATDDLSGVAETYYKINNGPTQTVSAQGQPSITTESPDNTLEYWSVDLAGNTETHNILTGIKLDKNPPTGTITINNETASTSSPAVTLKLSANDTSGIDQMRFSNNGTDWTPWETYATSKNWTLPSGDGEKTVYVQFKDNAGWVSSNYSATILLDTTKEGALPIALIIAGTSGIAAAAVALLYIKKAKFSAKH